MAQERAYAAVLRSEKLLLGVDSAAEARVHTAMAAGSTLQNEPGRHGVPWVEPTGHALPGAHAVQSLALVITTSNWFMCVPPGHGSGAADPLAQK